MPALPGQELVDAGLADLHAGGRSVEAFLHRDGLIDVFHLDFTF